MMPAERVAMRQVREIIRLKFSAGISTREIARRHTPLNEIFEKGEAIHSVGPDTLVTECVRLMTAGKIGALKHPQRSDEANDDYFERLAEIPDVPAFSVDATETLH
jgi:hypothetical protein